MFNKSDTARNGFQLNGSLKKQGYDWWWHNFTARDAETGEEKPFFVEFFLCNPGLGKKGLVKGQSDEACANGKKPSYLMVKCGTWGKDARQFHRFFPWSEVAVKKGADYSVSAADCMACETKLVGSVTVSEEEAALSENMCDAGSMSFNLSVEKKVAFNVGYGASTFFRFIKAFEMYWHAEGMKSFYSGEVVLDGRKYIVEKDTSYGYADKNWGRNFTSPWVWLSSCNLESLVSGKKLENSVFDIGGGCPKVYFVPLKRKLLSAFWYEGQCFEFNFSKFWTFCRTKFSYEETDEEIIWHVRQETVKAVMETEAHCLKKDMLLVKYESPDGAMRHNKLWNGGNGTCEIKLYKKEKGSLKLIDHVRGKNLGCEYGEYGNTER